MDFLILCNLHKCHFCTKYIGLTQTVHFFFRMTKLKKKLSILSTPLVSWRYQSWESVNLNGVSPSRQKFHINNTTTKIENAAEIHRVSGLSNRMTSCVAGVEATSLCEWLRQKTGQMTTTTKIVQFPERYDSLHLRSPSRTDKEKEKYY